MDTYSSLQYFLDDYSKTLFPLSINRFLIENRSTEITNYIYQNIIGGTDYFSPQERCYSSKKGFHLRRTVKLDPIAEFFIYDLIYRNRTSFRKSFKSNRRSFGYLFYNGRPVSPRESYTNFKSEISKSRNHYKYGIKFDIASYFNSLYHHDLVAWFSESQRAESDVQAFGKFFREINNGRSIDCLPHGINPCKVIGAEFLKFIDNSPYVQSEFLLRFMDDFYLFSNSLANLNNDIITIQKMMGEKGLSINPVKTEYIYSEENQEQNIDDIKITLLHLRRDTMDVSGEVEEQEELGELSKRQIEYLLDLLKEHDINEADVELILVLLRDHEEDVFEKIEGLLTKFPSITRNFYNFCKHIEDYQSLSIIVYRILKTNQNLTEDQLFWLAKIAEDFLLETAQCGDILHQIYFHKNATTISSAKVLEIPEERFGMDEIRREHLRTGKSDWLSWSSAFGCRNEAKIKRNHDLSYFSRGSFINQLIGELVKEIN